MRTLSDSEVWGYVPRPDLRRDTAPVERPCACGAAIVAPSDTTLWQRTLDAHYASAVHRLWERGQDDWRGEP